MRAALLLARAAREWVIVILRGDPARARPDRCIEGVPLDIVTGSDGRERLILQVSAGATEQIVLLDRVAAVRAAQE